MRRLMSILPNEHFTPLSVKHRKLATNMWSLVVPDISRTEKELVRYARHITNTTRTCRLQSQSEARSMKERGILTYKCILTTSYEIYTQELQF